MAQDDQVYIVAAARTPIGNFNGCFAKLSAADLGAVVIKEVLARANVKGEDVNEVIMGQSLLAGQGQNPGRQAARAAGLPQEVPGYTTSMLCGSGVKAVQIGYNSLRVGDAKVVVCGGQESMTRAPHVIFLREPTKLGDTKLVDTMLLDGLNDFNHKIHMGITAENLAKKYNISREAQDEYALNSQLKCENAQKAGLFEKEIVPVTVPDRRNPVTISKDEYPRFGATLDAFQKLKPCFITDGTGTVTPGNASGINDSAAAVLLMNGAEVKARNLTPFGRIVGFGQGGCDPTIMGIGVVPAVRNLCEKIGWKLEEVDIFELNEAFAAQSLSVLQELKIDQSKVNTSGGAIALGHPIGASGTRIIVTLVHAMERNNLKRGIASLCIGGGMGIAVAVERD